MSNLLLKAPYGYNHGIGVSFTFDNDRFEMPDYDDFALIMLSFSCHPFSVRKIYNSLKYSGQYSCYLQGSWFLHHSYFLKLLLGQHHIEINAFLFYQEEDEVLTLKYYNSNKESAENKMAEDKYRFLQETKQRFLSYGQRFLEDLNKRGIYV